jgi:hypothetical protein
MLASLYLVLLQCRSITQRDWSPEDSTTVINDENARNSIAIAIQSVDDSNDDINDTNDADHHKSGRCFSYMCDGGNIRPTGILAIQFIGQPKHCLLQPIVALLAGCSQQVPAHRAA